MNLLNNFPASRSPTLQESEDAPAAYPIIYPNQIPIRFALMRKQAESSNPNQIWDRDNRTLLRLISSGIAFFRIAG